MYICICKQVTDKQIEQAIYDGANTLSAIKNTLGASTECGSCTGCIKDMIEEFVMPINNIKIINSAISSPIQALNPL